SDTVDDDLGDALFGGEVDVHALAASVEEDHAVGFGAETSIAGRDVVGHDQVQSLALQLGGGARDQIVGLGGEADDDQRTAEFLAQPLDLYQDVRVAGQF